MKTTYKVISNAANPNNVIDTSDLTFKDRTASGTIRIITPTEVIKLAGDIEQWSLVDKYGIILIPDDPSYVIPKMYIVTVDNVMHPVLYYSLSAVRTIIKKYNLTATIMEMDANDLDPDGLPSMKIIENYSTNANK